MVVLFLIVVSYFLGRGVLRALYGSIMRHDFGLSDALLTGIMVIFGPAMAANLGAVILGRSFSDCVFIFTVGLIILLMIAAILILVERYRTKKNSTYAKEVERLRVKKSMTRHPVEAKEIIAFAVFGIMVLLQVLVMVTEKKLYLTGDMTVEAVNVILDTGTVGQMNPLTGRPYELGVPLRLEILCLPMLYAILCDVFGMSAIALVWETVPVLVLLGSYAAFYTVSKALFPTKRLKRGCFMVIVALLLWVGDYMYGMDGFGVMYAGFRGVTIRAAILLPYTFGLVMRKKWKLTVLCILAEACIVWTLYGMGACLFVVLGMVLLNWILGRLVPGLGKEDDRCGN